MDRSWMKYPHKSEYVDGLKCFLAQAKEQLDPIDDEEDDDGCADQGLQNEGLEELLEDIVVSTHVDNQAPSTQHGTSDDALMDGIHSRDVNVDEGNESFDKILREARQSLYPGSETFTKLDFLIKMLHIKVLY